MKTRHLLWLLGLFPLCADAQLPALPDGKTVKMTEQKQTAIYSMPRIEGNSVICGNKTVSFEVDGKIKISADGVAVGDLYCYYAVAQKKGSKVWWGLFNKNVSTLKRKGNVFEWELRRRVGKHVWKGAEQKLSITPDGLIKVEFTYLPFEHPELQLRDPRGSFWFMLNNKVAAGASHTFNGIPFSVPEKGRLKFDYKNKKRFDITLFAGDPAREIRILCDNKDIYWMMGQVYPAQKQSRLTYMFHKNRKAVLYFDLRQGVAVKSSNELRAGIDFKKIENMELPDGSRRNLLPNSSFERGLECYRLRHTNSNYRWGWKSYRVQNKEFFKGSNALELEALRAKQYPGDDFRRLHVLQNVTTATLILAKKKPL